MARLKSRTTLVRAPWLCLLWWKSAWSAAAGEMEIRWKGHHLQGAGAKNQRVNNTAPLQEGWCEGCGPGDASAGEGLPLPRLACMWAVGRPGQARPRPGRPAWTLRAKAGLGLLLVYIVRYLVRYPVRY